MTTTKNGRVFAYIAATCLVINALIGAYNLIQSSIEMQSFSISLSHTVPILGVIACVLYVVLAVTLFIQNETVVLIALTVTVLLDIAFFVKALTQWLDYPLPTLLLTLAGSFLSLLATAALTALLILLIGKKRVAGTIWFVPGILMVACILCYKASQFVLLGDYFTGLNPARVMSLFLQGSFLSSLILDALDIAAYFLIGMWIKKRTDSMASNNAAPPCIQPIPLASTAPADAVEGADMLKMDEEPLDSGSSAHEGTVTKNNGI